jgi:hypothetical protein
VAEETGPSKFGEDVADVGAALADRGAAELGAFEAGRLVGELVGRAVIHRLPVLSQKPATTTVARAESRRRETGSGNVSPRARLRVERLASLAAGVGFIHITLIALVVTDTVSVSNVPNCGFRFSAPRVEAEIMSVRFEMKVLLAAITESVL